MPTGSVSVSTKITGLSSFVKDVCFHNWKQNRQAICEPKWQKNIDAFNMVSTGIWKAEEGEDWRSNTFIPLTKMKIIAAWSIIIDMLLTNNKLPFNLLPSPWDDLSSQELPDEYKDAIDKQIYAMKKTIDQQFEDCHADRELMKCVMADAIYGECYSKFYIHEVTRKGYRPYSMAPEGMNDPQGEHVRWEPYEEKINAPGWEYISVWSIYRDLETDDLQAGAGIIHHQLWSSYELAQKKGLGETAYYIDEAIDRAISNAPERNSNASKQDSNSLPPGMRDINNRNKNIDVLEFWGRVPANIVHAFEADLLGEQQDMGQTIEGENDGNEIEIMCMIAGDEVIRYARNEPNHRPFYRSVWEINLDNPVGLGPADNLEGIQLVLNGGVRAFEDNKKLSGNVMGIGNLDKAPTWDRKFKPGLIIDTDDTVDDASKAFQQIVVADVGDSLLSLISLFERYGDDASQMPKIMQGATLDKRKPDTFSELNMLMQNAGKYIGGVIKNFDEGTLEPVCQDFYDYNMQDPDLKVGKGNFIAKATGFSSYQDRVIRLNKIMQALNIALSHEGMAQEVKFGEILKVVYESLDVDAMKVLKSEKDKLEEMDAAANSPARKMEEQLIKLKIENEMLNNAKIKAEVRKLGIDADAVLEKLEIEAFKAGMEAENKRSDNERLSAAQG